MRLDMNLPVLLFTLFAAALLQDLIPLTPLFPVKFGFLTAVGCYHALTKPLPVALTALVWAGAVTDLLGGLPVFCTIIFLLITYGVLRLMQRLFLTATLFQGTLLITGISVVQSLWTHACLGASGSGGWRYTLISAGYAAPAGLVAGFCGFLMCGLTDRLSGNVRSAKENHGILWPESDR